jgi:predicted transcriptional regulator
MNKVITARIEMTQEQQLELAREIMADRKETIAELEAKVEELSEALKNKDWDLGNATDRNSELTEALQVINKVINAKEVGKLPKRYDVMLDDTATGDMLPLS